MANTISDTHELASAAAAPSTTRRRASAHVRAARDRLTSTSGTRPVFDHELLRQFAQNRISASPVILLLVVTIGALSGLWTGALVCGVWTAGAHPAALVAHALHHARSVLRHGVDVHSDQSGRDRRPGRDLHAVRHAA